MPVKINYLSLINVDQNEIGQIDYFDTYIPPSKDFPYFLMDQKSTTLYYNNWPDLTQFMYTQKVKIIQTNKSITDSFAVTSFTNTAGQVATLNFTNANSVAVLKALLEDRESYYLENSTYTGWNKTFTPLSNITNGSVTFFNANANYYITGITVNNNTGTITASSLSTTVVSSAYTLTNINLEFGIYRIPGQTALQSVYYSGIKGRFISNNNTNVIFGSLKIRSQIIGHTHEHIHDMNDHTHTMPHTHDLSSHSHYMNHQHNYNDYRSNGSGLGFVPQPLTYATASTPPYDTYRVNNYTRDYTDGPSPNITGTASNSTTSTPSNNTTSTVQSRTTNQDNIFSNSDSFKVNSKILPETYTVYQYMYGKTYSA